MMDPLTAVGLASNVVQFLTFAGDLISKGLELSRSASGALEHNLAIEAVAQSLSVMSRTLMSSLPESNSKTSPAELELRKLCEGAKGVAETLVNALQKIKVTGSSDRAWKSFRQALKSILGAEQMEQMSLQIDRYRQQIGLTLMMSLREQITRIETNGTSSARSLQRELEELALSVESYRKDVIDLVRTPVQLELSLQSDWKQVSQIENAIARPNAIQMVEKAMAKDTDKVRRVNYTTLEGLLREDLTPEELRRVLRRDFEPERLKQALEQIKLRIEGTKAELTTHKNVDEIFPGRLTKLAEKDWKLQAQTSIHHQLYFSDIDQRYKAIADAHKDTFEWVFIGDNRSSDIPDSTSDSSAPQWDDFKSWLEGDETIYWVTGKPGSGKSTLMKFLYHDERTLQHAKSWTGSKPLVTSGFFIWNSGTQMQMSFKGLLQAILYKCLNGRLHLIPRLFPERWKHYDMYGRDLRALSDLELKEAFKNLVSISELRFLVFMDGLDEYDKNPSELTDFLLEVGKAGHESLKLCVASRPWPVFEESFSHCPRLRLEDLTRPDIQRYVEEALAQNSRWNELSTVHPDIAAQVVLDVSGKASGVFLWVILVVQSLVDGLIDGDTVEELIARVDQLPRDLEDLFQRMLGQLPPEYFVQACELFLLVQTAVRPLTLIETYFSLEGYDKAIAAAVKPLEAADLAFKAETIRKRIVSRCKCFLEAQGSYTERHNNTIQYFHRTVRDFMATADVQEYIRTGAPDFDNVGSLCGGTLRATKITWRWPMTDTILFFWTYAHPCVQYAKELDKAERITTLVEVLDELERTGDTYWNAPSKQGTWLAEVASAKGGIPVPSLHCMEYPGPVEESQTLDTHWTSTSLLTSNTGIESPVRSYVSFLHYAYEAQCTSYVLAKLNNPDIAIPEHTATRILLDACRNSDLELIPAVLKRGARPNASSRPGSPSAWDLFLGNVRNRKEKDKKRLEILYSLTTQFADASADPNAFNHPRAKYDVLPLETYLRELFDELGTEKVDQLVRKFALNKAALPPVQTRKDIHNRKQGFRQSVKSVFKSRAR
ncbi:hypothetical protein BDV96DRAFT_407813 [Lophiotrema nucula]|uniref:NACHT domain-containing protein n=1 Tax=Lophiotrema nucula TaxID=690887 RepID=A0A6A5ZI69_9PLEO|nr:hypothetical protein BDV96DRAFT_407813 [Lophiotrema nucula]